LPRRRGPAFRRSGRGEMILRSRASVSGSPTSWRPWPAEPATSRRSASCGRSTA
jgi:hypothetical protein